MKKDRFVYKIKHEGGLRPVVYLLPEKSRGLGKFSFISLADSSFKPRGKVSLFPFFLIFCYSLFFCYPYALCLGFALRFRMSWHRFVLLLSCIYIVSVLDPTYLKYYFIDEYYYRLSIIKDDPFYYQKQMKKYNCNEIYIEIMHLDIEKYCPHLVKGQPPNK